MSQGDLAAETDQQLHPEGAQYGVADLVADTEKVRIRDVWNAKNQNERQQYHLTLDKLGLKPSMVLFVVLVVFPAWKPGCRHLISPKRLVIYF